MICDCWGWGHGQLRGHLVSPASGNEIGPSGCSALSQALHLSALRSLSLDFEDNLRFVLSPAEQLPRHINLDRRNPLLLVISGSSPKQIPIMYEEMRDKSIHKDLTEQEFDQLLQKLQDAPPQHVIGLNFGCNLFLLFCIFFRVCLLSLDAWSAASVCGLTRCRERHRPLRMRCAITGSAASVGASSAESRR